MKSKKSQRIRGRAAPMHLHERIKLHLETTARLRDLIARCTSLRDAGKLTAARKLFAVCERLKGVLVELEAVSKRAHKR
jgi:hypothetical protein